MQQFLKLLLDVYVQLSMFRASSRPAPGAQQKKSQPLFLPLVRGGGSAVGRGRTDPTTTNSTEVQHVSGSNYTSINLSRMQNQRLLLQLLSS
jgi:hypothetical protein